MVKGSPAVHVDHDNTPEEELNTHCTRGKQGDVVSGGTDAGKEGRREERGESDNLGLREFRGISQASADAAVRVKVSEQHSRVESHRVLIVVFC